MSRTPFLRSSTNSVVSLSQISCRPRGGRREERRVAVVRRVVQLDEGADVDFPLPERAAESLPRRVGSRCPRLASVRSQPCQTPMRRALRRGGRKCRAARPCAGRSSVLRWWESPRPTRGCRPWRSVGPCAALALGIERQAEPGRRLADPAADLRRVLADAGGEDQRVHAASTAASAPMCLAALVHEVVHRERALPARACRAGRACRC